MTVRWHCIVSVASTIQDADPKIEQRLDADPAACLGLVALMDWAHEETATLLASAVASARSARQSWSAFGKTLDMSRQAAQQRWEHRRVLVGSAEVHRLKAEAWQRTGGMWFPWIYRARPTGEPANTEDVSDSCPLHRQPRAHRRDRAHTIPFIRF